VPAEDLGSGNLSLLSVLAFELMKEKVYITF
jgi:hypothetical protein